MHLGAAWQIMLETAQFYNVELERCRGTLKSVAWRSETVASAEFVCSDCGSGLVEQAEPAETNQESVTLLCRGCGKSQETERLIELAVSSALEAEGYSRAKDEGADGPVYTCPECSLETYIDFEQQCAACGFRPDEDSDCARCGGDIELDMVLYGDSSGLCGYCAHVSEKASRE